MSHARPRRVAGDARRTARSLLCLAALAGLAASAAAEWRAGPRKARSLTRARAASSGGAAEPGPGPVPAPPPADDRPFLGRLGRVQPVAFRFADPDPPPSLPASPMIDAQALARFESFRARQAPREVGGDRATPLDGGRSRDMGRASGGGTAFFGSGGGVPSVGPGNGEAAGGTPPPDGDSAPPASGDGTHNRDQGGKPADAGDTPGSSRRSR